MGSGATSRGLEEVVPPPVRSFQADEYARVYRFRHNAGRFGFFVRAPWQLVLELEVNFVVPPGALCCPSLGNYDYVIRVQTYLVGGSASRSLPPADSSAFVPLSVPIPIGSIGVLLWSVHASGFDYMCAFVRDLRPSVLIVMERDTQGVEVADLARSLGYSISRRGGDETQPWVFRRFGVTVRCLRFSLGYTQLFVEGSRADYPRHVVTCIFALGATHPGNEYRTFIPHLSCPAVFYNLYLVFCFLLAFFARTGAEPCHCRLSARFFRENGRRSPATVGFLLAFFARTGVGALPLFLLGPCTPVSPFALRFYWLRSHPASSADSPALLLTWVLRMLSGGDVLVECLSISTV
ncbi:uncharacterized protein G2W53_032780 [Senna tora]|uniref:Uncharacterized protein n=1 Tax=Senna tora TaxID=362788 RepID=A0A834WC64_9FABA|nr:uncharacterized protein G2W53_032780 [Senna tora]